MIYDLKKILDIGEENGFAVPAFNVYNLETVMGVMQAAEETGAPVIFQMYSRLFDSQIAQYVAPIIREAMNNMKTPVAFHLDHGAGVPEVLRAFRYGATGVMIDASRKPLEENIAITKGVVEMAAEMGIGVEGELGEVGKAAEGVSKDYTKVEDAAKFVNETGLRAGCGGGHCPRSLQAGSRSGAEADRGAARGSEGSSGAARRLRCSRRPDRGGGQGRYPQDQLRHRRLLLAAGRHPGGRSLHSGAGSVHAGSHCQGEGLRRQQNQASGSG